MGSRDGEILGFPIAVCVALLTSAAPAIAMMVAASGRPVVDPEVREHVSRGRARVLVELRVSSPADGPDARAEAIAAAQRALIERLAGIDIVVARRYATTPYLALEIDADGLAALERMGDLVVRVMLDRPVRPSR